MLNAMTHKPVGVVIAAGLCLAGGLAVFAGSAVAATPIPFSGAITGLVTDAAGVPQMGAAVILFNKQNREFEKVLTDGRGNFKFLGLIPDVYSLKVTLAAFVPAWKKNILVQPGMRSVFNVNLNTLFSSIQIAYPALENGSLMSDDWKWVLRTAPATRPVMRFNEDALARNASTRNATRNAVFTGTRGVLKVSAGEGPLATGIGNEADLGTAFALATSLYGNNTLQVSGNVGYGSQTGVPSAAIRTSYSRNLAGGTPEVSVTMRQIFLPGRVSAALGGNEGALPMLRSMSASFDDRTQLTDELSAQYGFTLNSVSFLDHLNYASPYARLAWSLGDAGQVEFAYTSGDARPDLAGGAREEAEFQHDLNSLGIFPRISLRDGRPHVQRGQNFEMSYKRKLGSRSYQLAAFRESVSHTALSIVAPAGFYSSGDILPDLFTGSATFDAGNLQSAGYTASVTQSLGENLTATVIYGTMGGLTADRREIVSNSPDELRAMIHASRKQAATARISATSPWTGTHMIASYQWTPDRRFATPGHLYSTEASRPLPGLNVHVRQPIPGLGILPWRMEATADLRNLLAQGYLPLGIVDGQRVLLVETPRGFRGGLSFIF